MNLFTLLTSRPPEITGSAVLSKVGLVGLAQLESAVPSAKFQAFLAICYTTVDPVALPEHLPPNACVKPLRWLFTRNLKVCGLMIDDSNEELVPYIAKNIHFVRGGIKLHCINDQLDPFTCGQYP
jgi:hypothetical protein